MKKIVLVLWVFFLFSCSDEQKNEPSQTKSVPVLPAVKAPESLQGLYVGRIPCDDCKGASVTQLKMLFDSVQTVEITESFYQEPERNRTSVGTYLDSAGFLFIRFTEENRELRFRKNDGFSFHLVDFTGNEYTDESGTPFLLNRILNSVKK